MKKQVGKWSIVCILICFLAIIVCSGCETCKGIGKDIKNADDWFKEHAW